MNGPAEVTIGVAYAATTLVYGFVGWRLARRPVSASSALAATQFTVWWYGLAVMTGVLAVEAFAASAGMLGFALALTLYLFQLLVDSLLLWGLVGYLTFMYTGKNHFAPLALFFGGFYLDALYYVISQQPYAVTLPGGVPTIEYMGNLGTANPLVVGYVVFGSIVPPFAGAFLYLSLYTKTKDPTLRYRILLVGSSIILFFLVAFTSPPASVVNPTLWTVVARALDVVAALIALAAYYPPGYVRRRLGVTGVDEVPPKGDLAPRSASSP